MVYMRLLIMGALKIDGALIRDTENPRSGFLFFETFWNQQSFLSSTLLCLSTANLSHEYRLNSKSPLYHCLLDHGDTKHLARPLQGVFFFLSLINLSYGPSTYLSPVPRISSQDFYSFYSCPFLGHCFFPSIRKTHSHTPFLSHPM